MESQRPNSQGSRKMKKSKKKVCNHCWHTPVFNGSYGVSPHIDREATCCWCAEKKQIHGPHVPSLTYNPPPFNPNQTYT